MFSEDILIARKCNINYDFNMVMLIKLDKPRIIHRNFVLFQNEPVPVFASLFSCFVYN
jgi:hypothetical protein